MTGFMDMQYATGDGSSLSRIMKSILSPSGTQPCGMGMGTKKLE